MNDTTTTPTEEVAGVPPAEQVAAFMRIVAAPHDILELRLIRKADGAVVKHWRTPVELVAAFSDLHRHNQAGYDIYVGANARRHGGISGDAAILSARSVFVDCDPANGF